MQTFDWHKDTISENTLITDSYKNTQNVRRFFKSVCGNEFTFDRHFMHWMKQEGQGKTMGDAAHKRTCSHLP